MLPVRIKVVNLGDVEREYREIVRFYEDRISSLSRFRVENGDKIPAGAILLDSRGREMSSDEFYEMLRRKASNGEEIVFAVGPPEGFSEDARSAHPLFSLSRFTLRHELAYLVLLEQIYRALLRMKGTRYER